MKKPKLSPFEYSDYHAYLKDFVDLCKTTLPKFSHRSFAQDIGWQIGYLVDVMKFRKNLSLTRAFQLAQHQGLGHLETEHLIQLVLKEDLAGVSRGHFQRKLREEGYDSYRNNTTADRELVENVELDAVYSAIRWARKPLLPHEIKEVLYTFELEEGRIQNYLSILQEKGIVKFHADGSLEVLQKEIAFDDFYTSKDGGIHINRRYAENFVRFSQNRKGPALFNSGLIEIPTSAFPSIVKKMLDLRNWILEISRETVESSKSYLSETELYQVDLNLFSVLDPKANIFKQDEKS
jgi:hypothetical protein